MSGRKDVGKEAHILAAAIKCREGLGVSEIARQLMQPRSTVHNWLARLRDRGLEGISDRTAPNYKPILGEMMPDMWQRLGDVRRVLLVCDLSRRATPRGHDRHRLDIRHIHAPTF